jgi:hypothetical protein
VSLTALLARDQDRDVAGVDVVYAADDVETFRQERRAADALHVAGEDRVLVGDRAEVQASGVEVGRASDCAV